MQGLKYKWISAQEPRLMMRYKSLIKTALGLGLVRLKRLFFLTRYNDSQIVITVQTRNSSSAVSDDLF
jgi:hypothetical protein